MRNNLNDAARGIIRFALGIIFIAHGAQKLFGLFGGTGMAQFTQMVTGMGLPWPSLWAYLAALSEFAGGTLLLLGIIPRISAGFIAATMLVAILKVHWAHGFFMMNGGFEYPFILLVICIALILTGSGKYSLYNRF